MTPIERLREAAAVPADDVTVSRTDLADVLEMITDTPVVQGEPESCEECHRTIGDELQECVCMNGMCFICCMGLAARESDHA